MKRKVWDALSHVMLQSIDESLRNCHTQPNFMNNLEQLSSSLIMRLSSLLWLLSLCTASLIWAEGPQPTPPAVFQPDEIQHGFAEFDSPPDFFEDETPAPYDTYSDSPSLPSFDQKPEGLFQNLTFAKDIEEDHTIRRGHIQVPIHPTDTFPTTINSVYLVFSVYKHYAPYQVIGRLFSETRADTPSTQWIDEDIASLATEDESGYLKFFPPDGVWTPGQYRVYIYVGYMVNTLNKMGAMRFHIQANRAESTKTPQEIP